MPALTQTVFSQPAHSSSSSLSTPHQWRDTLMIPVYASFLSLALLLLQIAWKARQGRTKSAYTPVVGRGSYILDATRILAVVLTIGASVAAIVRTKHRAAEQCTLELAQCLVFTYTLVLSAAASVRRTGLHHILSAHRTSILLASLAVFVYRDLWPYATYDLTPQDASLGWIVWARLGLITYAGAVVPLILPGVYIPVDPTNPLPPNEEQLSSVLSRAFFTFVDSIVRTSLKHDHLPVDELPLLADEDHCAHLKKTSFTLLDPTIRKSSGHIGWVFIRFYLPYGFAMSFTAIARATTGFITPYAILKLLQHVETGGAGATMRPWFWVLALFLQSIIWSVISHRYLYLVTKLRVQLEAIITQLVFEHALRIRIKDEKSTSNKDSDDGDTATTTSSNPDSESGTTAAAVEDLPIPEIVVTSTADGAQDPPVVVAAEATAAVSAVANASSNKEKTKKDEDEETANIIGKINNLITSDLANIVELPEIPALLFYTPLKIGISVWFLYSLLGWSFFVALVVMLLGFLIPGRLAGLMRDTQTARSKKTDARVQAIHETVGLLRLVKMFGWEDQMEDRLAELRGEELGYIRRMLVLSMINNQISWTLPVLTLIVTYFTFTVVMGKPLQASIAFSSLGVLDSLREAIFRLMYQVPNFISGKVSLDRIDAFLRDTELVDTFSASSDASLLMSDNSREIGFHNAQFTWSTPSSSSGRHTPTGRNFVLRAPGDVHFARGGLSIVVGPTGAGKTSVLLALLGEMHFIPDDVGAWFNLSRNDGVAYCPQESWVLNETIRDNIVFGQEFDELRYREVLYECALDRDLSLFEAGDRTEVGERGLTLSGGQKARVSLARAVYSRAEIVLLDDILAALDVHTAHWVVKKCLKGKLLRGRTVILVTHNLSLVKNLAERVLVVSSNGTVTVEKSTDDALAREPTLQSELDEQDDSVDSDVEVLSEVPEKVEGQEKPSGKLVAVEEVVVGSGGFSAIRMFFQSMGGSPFWIIYAILVISAEILEVGQLWWIGKWGEQYQTHSPEQVNVAFYISVFVAIVAITTIDLSAYKLLWVRGSLNASRFLHASLTKSILHTTLHFLDRTPVGRIIQRFTQDTRSIDGELAKLLDSVLQLTASLLSKMVVIIIFTPAFLVPGVVLGVIGAIVTQVYMKAQMPIKRELSLARAPLLSHVGAAIQGVTSIRAYGAQEAFVSESIRRIDRLSRVARPYWNLNRWVAIRIDAIGGIFSSVLAAYLVLIANPNAALIGLQLNLSFGATSMLLYWVRILNAAQVEANSVERIQQYITIEHEPVATPSGEPPASWPTSGSLHVERLTARYSLDGPAVLRDLTFDCASGEKIGIVGRTGSGKSSLTLALLRLIPTEGTVVYDGQRTDDLNLDALRHNITIIPQQPELVSGSLRENLDPFKEHDDAELNDALRSAGLFTLQEDLPREERITLDTSVGTSGGNFSLGQRQIIALARALVRQSKVLILDEATASMDHKTDTLIQKTLRTQFKDCTVLTIAHRLHTIMDSDKILVLDAGELVEFESPQDLLSREGGVFKTMVDGSGEQETLYSLAGVH